MLYKGQLMADQLDQFYLDLSDPQMVSAIAMVHSRYSTNTFPTWALAHPFRMLSPNGEIHTLRGNLNWLRARERQLISKAFGEEDTKKILPIVVPHGSDSATFDNVFELMVLAGRSLPHAIMMMIPEAWEGDEYMPQEKKDFYEYNACLMEPWDGPAGFILTDGRYAACTVDRNGLRPARWVMTRDRHITLAS